MSMIYAKDMSKSDLRSANVYDARGRKLELVLAFNADTGEVITYSLSALSWLWLKLLWKMNGAPLGRSPRFKLGTLYLWNNEIVFRHGFWPAPLSVKITT